MYIAGENLKIHNFYTRIKRDIPDVLGIDNELVEEMASRIKNPEKYTIVVDRLRFIKSQFKENDFRIYIDRFINEMTIGQLSKKYNLPKSKIKLICLNGKKVVMNIKELER